MKKILTILFTLGTILGYSQGITVTVGDVAGKADTLIGDISGSQVIGGVSADNADSLNGEAPAFYLSRTNHTDLDSTNDIVGFQDSVTANTNVTANTVHKSSDGSDHSFIDQSVISGSSPAFDGKNIKGIHGFFLQPRGLFGSGPGFADEGFIGDMPVILFAANSTEKSIYTFFALSRIILTDTNPTVNFIVYSTTAPVATTSDSVRWQLEARYVAETESATKAADETFLITQGLPTTIANTRQTILQFILDKTLITDQDVLLFTLSRIGGDGSDIYSADIAIGQSGIRAEASSNNP